MLQPYEGVVMTRSLATTAAGVQLMTIMSIVVPAVTGPFAFSLVPSGDAELETIWQPPATT